MQLAEHRAALAAGVEAIQSRRDGLLKNWNEFKQAAVSRRSKLENSKGLQEFLRNAEEIEQWIEDKMKISTDESYKDPSNMQVCCSSLTFELRPRPKLRSIKHLKRKFFATKMQSQILRRQQTKCWIRTTMPKSV
jgi:hypothetical protein